MVQRNTRRPGNQVAGSRLAWWILTALAVGCARQGFPPGGPVDRVPPRVVRTWPEAGSTGVPLQSEIVVEFSERVVPSVSEDAVFLSPPPEDGLRLRWKGRLLRIRVPGGLRPDRTYVLTLGTGIRDLRNNPMRQAHSIAFSTGAKIDSARLEGVVFRQARPVPGVLVSAYDLAELPDPDPGRSRATYLTQTGSDGQFRLLYLRASSYRLFAWEDRDADRLWDEGEEAIGVPWRDIDLRSDSTAGQLSFWLVPLDSTAPRIVDARSSDRRHLTLRTSEKIDSLRSQLQAELSVDVPALIYRDDLFGDRLHVAAFQDLRGEVRLRVEGISDRLGNRCRLDSAVVNVSDLPDTSRPRLVLSIPADSARGVPLEAPIDLWFSEALDTAAASQGAELIGPGDEAIPCVRVWATPAHLRLVPEGVLQGGSRFVVRLQGPRLRDVSGNPLTDSLLVLQFWTLNPDTLTEILGVVEDGRVEARGSVHVVALRAADGQAVAERILAAPGPYRLAGLLPGRYLLMAFRDEDGDGALSPGWPWPFRPAERFFLYPDTVRARARWANEGNDLRLPP
ncbi:MAG: Ig-like domain-containing protein [candidate division KSB1 bacterium]|nr:Ig-like domain-containing protein [candidate division KSB1 bacterium]